MKRTIHLPRIARVSVLALPFLVGCFSDPAAKWKQMKCRSDKNCPVKYVCADIDSTGYGHCSTGPSDGGIRDGAAITTDLGTGLRDGGTLDVPLAPDAPLADAPLVTSDGGVTTTDATPPSTTDTPILLPTDSGSPDTPVTVPLDARAGDTAVAPPSDALAPDTAPPKFDAPQVGVTPTSLGLAPGGITCASANYKAVLTLGQSPGGNIVMQSTNYRFVGGLVGATQ